MTDARFVGTPTAHTAAELSAEYTTVSAVLSASPTAHVNADLATNEPGP